MGEPRVTIGLPVFNGENFLDRALESLRRQTFEDFEIIVSDNGSTDRTHAIAKQHAQVDQRVRYVRHPRNLGASFNANFTVSEARGEYFKLASHDDEVAPEMIASCVARLDEDPDTVLCYPKTALIDARSRLVGVFEDRMKLRSQDPCRRFHRLLRVIDRCNPIFGVVRTQTFRQTRLFPPYVASDRVALAELALRGKFAELQAPMFLRRMHAGISTRANPRAALLLAWFDPDERSLLKRRFPGSWLKFEYARAILRAPLSARQKQRCLASLQRVTRLRFTGQGKPTAVRSYQRQAPADRVNERDQALRSLQAAIRQGDWAAASPLADRLARLDPQNPSVLCLRSLLAMNRGRPGEALRLARAGACRAGDRVANLVTLGVAEAAMGHRSQALRATQLATVLAPDSESARHNRAMLERTKTLPDPQRLKLVLPAD